MLVMVSPALDEVVAMGQFVSSATRAGKPFWRTFWIGGTVESASIERSASTRSEESATVTSRAILGALDLRHVPMNLIVSAALGIWLLAAPAALGVTGRAADSSYLAGALIVTWAVIAFGEIARPIRLLNVPIGLWVAIAPWVLAGATPTSRWLDLAVGLAIAALSVRRGRIEERFGNWNRYLF
jgi:hypothetical protein